MAGSKSTRRIINKEKRLYINEKVSPPSHKWDVAVQTFYKEIKASLFQPGLRISDVREQSGIRNHNISSDFKWWVGKGPKRFILDHRLNLAKRLLEYEWLTVTQITYAVGYESASAFSQMFKNREKVTPTTYRKERNS